MMMSAFPNIKTSVKDSLEEDDGSEDVEDEVFIRDGRNSCRLDEEIKRPLMAPRRKCKQNPLKRDLNRRRCLFNVCSPYCKISVALFVLTCLALILISLFNNFSGSIEKLKLWALSSRIPGLTVIPSTQFSKEEIWMRTFPNLRSEDSLTLAKLNSDDIEDIIIGYSSGETQCGSDVCLGGALALDGKTGATLWQAHTRHQILFVDCSSSINRDSTYDCLLSGKGGYLCIVNGKTGEILWDVNNVNSRSSAKILSNQAQVYSAQYIPDIDGDGWSDVLAALTLHSKSNLSILSGHTGRLLGQIVTPARLLTLPRVVTSQDETLYVLFGTGTLDTPGYLFSTPLYNIVNSDTSKVRKLWSGEGGVSSDLLLVDMNQDKREDVILTSGGSIVLLDGNNFNIIWNISFGQQSQILVGPIPGYFDNDKIPDLLVTKLVGDDFPTFYYSETQVFSGRDGSKLLEDSIIGSGDITGEGISVSFTGPGNDMYLYWLTTCHQTDKNQSKPFSLPPGLSLETQATIDLCRIRFNSSLETRLFLLSDHIEPPGYLIYSSDKSWKEEHLADNTTPMPRPDVMLTVPQDDVRPPQTPVDDGIYEQQDSVDAWDYSDPSARFASIKAGGPEYDQRPFLAEGVPIDYANKEAETLGSIADNMKIPGSFDNLPEGNKMAENYDTMAERNKMEAEPFDSNGDDYGVRRKKRRTQHHHTVPRSSTTPILASGLSGGIDIIFASHWITSPDISVNERCIQRKASRQGSRRTWKSDCSETSTSPDDINSSQLSVYRLKIISNCSLIDLSSETCSQPFPTYSQSFSHRDTHQYFKQRIFLQ